jgi:hypothetical protein
VGLGFEFASFSIEGAYMYTGLDSDSVSDPTEVSNFLLMLGWTPY